MRARRFFAVAIAGTVILASSSLSVAADRGEFIDFGFLPGGFATFANGVSADGSTAVGYGISGWMAAFRWTDAGLTELGYLNSGSNAVANAVNVDGDVIVGWANDGADGDAKRAFRWTVTGGMESLGTLNGGSMSNAYGVSASGAVVVGTASDGVDGDQNRAFRWTRAGGMVSLGTLNGGLVSEGFGVSGDGLVVVGSAEDGAAGFKTRAFRWDVGSGQMTSLGVLGSDTTSAASGANADGSVVVGYSSSLTGCRAFRWTAATNRMTDLGDLGDNYAVATAVSGDGKVVVGHARDASAGNASRAFRWTEGSNAMISVEQWLTEAGVDMTGIVLEDATGTNADGSVIVGYTGQYGAYLARRSAPLPAPPSGDDGDDGGGGGGGGSGGGGNGGEGDRGSGVISLDDFHRSLLAVPGAPSALRFGEIVYQGRRAHPLRSFLDDGQMALWSEGDLAWLLTAEAPAQQGLSELGIGIGLAADWTVRMAGGVYGERVRPDTGGHTVTRLAYLLPELSMRVGDGLHLTASAFAAAGTQESRRAYRNGAVRDISRGEAEVTTYGARLRAEYEDAVRLGTTAISPFASVTGMVARHAAFAETDGAFPVVWDADEQAAAVIRAGIGATHPLTDSLTWLGHAELSYGVPQHGTGASGMIIGLSRFETGERSAGGFGAQAGIGLEASHGTATASLMLNAATGANNPTAWLSASYSVRF